MALYCFIGAQIRETLYVARRCITPPDVARNAPKTYDLRKKMTVRALAPDPPPGSRVRTWYRPQYRGPKGALTRGPLKGPWGAAAH